MKINFKTQRLLKAKTQEKKEFVLISVFFLINDFYRCSVSITTNLSYKMLYIVYYLKVDSRVSFTLTF